MPRKASRPPLARMLRIHEQLQKNIHPNCRKLGALLEVAAKTIQRDIDFMRDQLCLPIEYNQKKFGYYYTEAVTSFPTVQVSEGELVALYVAQKAMAQYRGTVFEKPLQAAFHKLTDGLRDQVSFELGHWDSFFSFHSLGTTVADLELFERLSTAVTQSREISFLYKKLSAQENELRHVQPYHLASIDNQWYLFAFDLDRSEIRTFALPRIESVELGSQTFTIAEDFSISEMLKNSFGVFSGQQTYEVRIAFDSWASRLIQERLWHPSQNIISLADNSLELTLTINSLPEIERWILSWGPHAKVLEPKELKDSILKSLSNMQNLYP
ncbi:MAG: WYL domain-containing protein [Verrucomicrobiota bacterium]